MVGWGTITLPKKSGGLNVRIAREANTFLLVKLVWDIHTNNNNKLWVQTICSKYLGDLCVLKVPKKNCSTTWNSVMKARGVLRDGFNFWLGYGATSLWYSPWTSFGKLSQSVLFVDIHNTSLCIRDMIIDGTGTSIFSTLSFPKKFLIISRLFACTPKFLIASLRVLSSMVCIQRREAMFGTYLNVMMV